MTSPFYGTLEDQFLVKKETFKGPFLWHEGTFKRSLRNLIFKAVFA